jgi:hypothetical protein
VSNKQNGAPCGHHAQAVQRTTNTDEPRLFAIGRQELFQSRGLVPQRNGPAGVPTRA